MFFAPAIRSGSLVSPNPRSDFDIDIDFDRFMSQALGRLGMRGFDLREDDDAWTVSVDMPGIGREHVCVNIEGDTLRIDTAQESKRQFKAVYQLPGEVDPEKAEASLEHGVLTLRLGKAQARNRRSIPVR